MKIRVLFVSVVLSLISSYQCQDASPQPVQCGNYKVIPANVTNLANVMGNYYGMDINKKHSQLCGTATYTLTGPNQFSKITKVFLNGTTLPITGNGTLVAPGKISLQLHVMGQNLDMVFYLLATDYKSYIVLFNCMNEKLSIIIETKSKSYAINEEAVNIVKAKNLPLSLIDSPVNKC